VIVPHELGAFFLPCIVNDESQLVIISMAKLHRQWGWMSLPPGYKAP
jgi:hypothetical protein